MSAYFSYREQIGHLTEIYQSGNSIYIYFFLNQFSVSRIMQIINTVNRVLSVVFC